MVEEGTWKLPPATAAMLDDNHLDDVDALVTLARCIGRAERRMSSALRAAIDDELAQFAAAWVGDDESSVGEPAPDGPVSDEDERGDGRASISP